MRTNLTLDRFSNLTLLNIEKDLTNKLNTEHIINALLVMIVDLLFIY